MKRSALWRKLTVKQREFLETFRRSRVSWAQDYEIPVCEVCDYRFPCEEFGLHIGLLYVFNLMYGDVSEAIEYSSVEKTKARLIERRERFERGPAVRREVTARKGELKK